MQFKIGSINTLDRHKAYSFSGTPDRGWGFLEQGGIALVIIFVIIVVLGGYNLVKKRVNVGLEAANIQTLITTGQNLMKSAEGYDFTSTQKMTGALIQMDAVPKSMTVRGTPSSGIATLHNVWGGAVTLGAVASAASGFNSGFSVTYEKVPQAECIQLVTQVSRSQIANGITLNSTGHNDGIVTTEEASSQCTADSGNAGTNRLVFTVNS
ncbi:type 4 pilus major pilin [Pectobacterium atrosepticum]|uniref:type 4 pilus major pilin n=1 Tax=Pectobacterium atrosepticum TaxID=29471 RepID=UPI003017F063